MIKASDGFPQQGLVVRVPAPFFIRRPNPPRFVFVATITIYCRSVGYRLEPARRDFERPESAPRSRAGAQACAVVYTRLHLRAPQPRARELTRGRKRNVWPCAKKGAFGTCA